MAKCFCGCGRKAGSLFSTVRTCNRLGSAIRKQLSAFEGLDAHIAAHSPEPEQFHKVAAPRMAEGSELRQQCLEVVHGDKPYRDVDLQRLEAWVDDTTKLIDFFSQPPETRKQIVAEAGEWP